MKALIRGGLCVALGWLASSAGAQEALKWKSSATNANSVPAAVAGATTAGPTVSLSQPTPLEGPAPTPASSFRVISGAPPATVRAQNADDRPFQIESLLEPGTDKKSPPSPQKDKGFVPPPPTPLSPMPQMDGFGTPDGCGCDNPCGSCDPCGSCGPRLSGLRGWGMGDPGNRYQAWASAEYLMWWQRGQATPPLVVVSPGGTPTAQTGLPGTSAVLYDHTPNYNEGGARFGVGTWLPCFCNNLGIEVNYFFLARQSATSTFDSPGDPQLSRPFITSSGVLASEPFALQNATDAAHGSATIHDYTQLWGIDANLRYKLWRGPNCWVDLLVGYRYINLSEGIGITEDRFNQTVFGLADTIHTRESESFETRNEFNGVQIGVDSEVRLWDRWFLGMNAKVAMGSMYQVVNINGSTTFSNDPFGNGTQPGALLASTTNIGNHTQNRFAVAPEVGFKIGYDVTDHLRVFAGYNFLYLSSVVRPGDQIDLNVNPAFRPASGTTPGFGNVQSPALAGPRVPAVLMNTTNYWAQGLTFGVMYRY
jgi:hypothetical protein